MEHEPTQDTTSASPSRGLALNVLGVAWMSTALALLPITVFRPDWLVPLMLLFGVIAGVCWGHHRFQQAQQTALTDVLVPPVHLPSPRTGDQIEYWMPTDGPEAPARSAWVVRTEGSWVLACTPSGTQVRVPWYAVRPLEA